MEHVSPAAALEQEQPHAAEEAAVETLAVAEPAPAAEAADLAIMAELVIEEISIDGMCGVY